MLNDNSVVYVNGHLEHESVCCFHNYTCIVGYLYFGRIRFPDYLEIIKSTSS